ncbi:MULTISPECIES: hypothetical protein [Spirosoma]|uniref:Uncharacterized protein n=1 Tax=Spirosoma sordidisoli TaxID=2502893 RepID=A0A4Q2UQ97_9BACT|nr:MULTISPECIES: hypothetical protein [Spirosoma]RYC69825.1 hypothetical protein EQG79_14625 [Spirosoma sordidisoli]
MRTYVTLLMLLWAGSTLAQSNLPLTLAARPIQLYPSSPASLTGTLQGDPVAVTVRAKNFPVGTVLPDYLQPGITRNGQTFSINWTSSQTQQQPSQIWLEIRVEQTVVWADYIQFVAANRNVATQGQIQPVNVSNLTRADLLPLSTSIAAVSATLPTKLDSDIYSAFLASQASIDAGQTTKISSLSAGKVDLSSYNVDKSNMMLSIGLKANTGDVYTKAQADAKKPDIVAVTTFEAAQALSVAGRPTIYLITNDERFGRSVTYWDGSTYSVSPLISR